ncbi:MAG TPA: SGNH/GDSL hydrolase family protein, partial [Vicinamibacterales bacterium]|nr:SGNH/GDSL hydrolase family protein [Vicinamibacterales bacterium]
MKLYLALGDSISIDEYPARETGIPDIGAASLFHRDLLQRHPGIAFVNLTADGATSDDVLRDQLPRVKPTHDPAIVTITAGGNDMLMNLRAPAPPANLVEGILARVAKIVDDVTRKLPNAIVLLGTIYDPSDGTNVLYGEKLEREAKWLARVNHGIRALAASRENVRLADIHRHFLGHGLTAPERERWYWSGLIFEPNARGAEEVRNLWLAAL